MATLHVRGEIDLVTGEAFERALARVDTDLVVNLGEVVFIDAAGLRALAVTADRLGRRGRLFRLERPPPHVRRLLTVLDLGHLLNQ